MAIPTIKCSFLISIKCIVLCWIYNFPKTQRSLNDIIFDFTHLYTWPESLGVCHVLHCLLYVFSWRLRRPHWGNADGVEGIFGFCRTRVGCCPASGPTLKIKALCRTFLEVGRRTNKVFVSFFTQYLILLETTIQRDFFSLSIRIKASRFLFFCFF